MITIFTPIYNRAYIIEQLYQSLKRQTSYTFEWLIVDDGSTDNIAELVQQWIKDTHQFQISFYQQRNGGKHRAINYGVRLASSDAFFIVDSDDYLEEDAVDIISKYWNDIKEDEKFAGIAGLRRHVNGETIGGKPCFDHFVDATNLERAKWGLNGDKAEVYKTDVLRKYPFPEYEDERFITEAVVWNRIAFEGYNLRWINKSFVVCEYQEDGLTAKGKQLFIENPRGWAHYIRSRREYEKIEQEIYLSQCFHFYEIERTWFNDPEIRGMLNLKAEEYEMILDEYGKFVKCLSEICANKRICIYAYGNWGKRLKEFLDRLGIRVEYVIDRNFSKISGIDAYSDDMNLPQTDIVIVALKNGVEEVTAKMSGKMPETELVLLKDIKPNVW